MNRLALAAGLLVWAGSALLLSQWSRLGRPSLAERLRPFHPGRTPTTGAPVNGMVDGLAPLVGDVGDRLAAALGVSEGAARRLARIHSPTPAVLFRMRQAGMTATALVGAAFIALWAGAAGPLAAFMVLGAPTLTFLVVEQGLARRSEAWQRSTADELPVVAEQLAMLLNAGFSVGAALQRLAERSQGCTGRDLDSVVNRIHQGLTETAALREWADRARVDSVGRLVAVLTLHGQAADLGRLVSAEARAARRDLQRRTVEQIERRAQQVWVPVTVATLVPGAILLAVPFLAALHTFANA